MALLLMITSAILFGIREHPAAALAMIGAIVWLIWRWFAMIWFIFIVFFWLWLLHVPILIAIILTILATIIMSILTLFEWIRDRYELHCAIRRMTPADREFHEYMKKQRSLPRRG
jgi:hypothetical protein